MPFKDLREFFDGSLRLPVGGKEYVVRPISMDDGLWAQSLMDVGANVATGRNVGEKDVTVLDDDDERSLYQRMLGPVFDELYADGVDWPSVQRCGVTAFLFFTLGEEAAMANWEGRGKAAAPNRETKRAAARSTRSRGSASGTTSRKAKKAPPTPGA